MLPDNRKIIEAIRETAALEIMPRFKTLSGGDIREKSPGDMVTTADVEAEKRLASLIRTLAPGGIIIGEEEASINPKLINALKEESSQVWLIDPLDGTANFVRGDPCFATIAACCKAGETIAGWIYDPIAGATAWAIKGEGAWIMDGNDWSSKRPLRAAVNAQIAQMKGSLGGQARRDLARRLDELNKGGGEGSEAPKEVVHYGCVGREYMDLAAGALHFCHYARRLKPWDHAAGVLLHREAGGFSAMIEDGSPYDPAKTNDYANATLLLAPCLEAWRALKLVFGE